MARHLAYDNALRFVVRRPSSRRLQSTGISGGGDTTFWITAADERVKVAVPVSGQARVARVDLLKGFGFHG